VHRSAALLTAAGVLGLAGCASHGDLIAQERRLAQQLAEQRRQIQAMQREIERLRGDVEGGGPRAGGDPSRDQRLQDLEDRMGRLEGPPDPNAPPADAGARDVPPPVAAVPPPREVPPPPPPADDSWARDVSRDQQAIAASNAAEREQVVSMLDAVARKDCGRAVGQLNTFAAQNKQSPLASTALYWVGRCHALKGDRQQAITKFYDVVTKYPRGSKAPAALWEQGNLFIDMGDTPDARLALGKLIKDYPNSDEASRARKRLTELDDR
jgi:tol-pal system protein YbgF